MAQKLILIVNGLPRAGKDSAVRLMRAQLEVRDWRTAEFSSIDLVRDILKALPVPQEKTQAYRDALAEIGFSLEKFCNFRTRACTHRIQNFMRTDDSNQAFFLHVREPAMIDQLRSWAFGHGFTLRVIMVTGRGENITSNAADARALDTVGDYFLDNSGSLVSLSDQVAWLCALFAGEGQTDG